MSSSRTCQSTRVEHACKEAFHLLPGDSLCINWWSQGSGVQPPRAENGQTSASAQRSYPLVFETVGALVDPRPFHYQHMCTNRSGSGLPLL